MSEAKQTALVGAIATAVHDKTSAEFAAISNQLTELHVSLEATLARMELLEQAIAVGAPKVAKKKAVNTASAAGVDAAAPAKGGAKSAVPANGLLFTKHALMADLFEYRARYADMIAKYVPADKTTLDKNPDAYWKAAGDFLWKAMTIDQKNVVRENLKTFKEAGSATAEAQLEPETGGMEVEEDLGDFET